jgi:hypothetical protein
MLVHWSRVLHWRRAMLHTSHLISQRHAAAVCEAVPELRHSKLRGGRLAVVCHMVAAVPPSKVEAAGLAERLEASASVDVAVFEQMLDQLILHCSPK